MVTIKTTTLIRSDIDTCFEIACDLDLHCETVWKCTNETIIGTGGKVGLGDLVTFRATHFFVRQNFTSKVIEYDRPTLLVDQMTKGAFKSFLHIHEFQSANGFTKMTDTITFETPFGILGKVVEHLILKHYLKLFIQYRNKQIRMIAEGIKIPKSP